MEIGVKFSDAEGLSLGMDPSGPGGEVFPEEFGKFVVEILFWICVGGYR